MSDQKLEALLDLHLEQGIDSREYKKKKNQLLDQKLETEDKIKRIKKDGSHWLEPFNEFINDAINASKIAHQENMDNAPPRASCAGTGPSGELLVTNL